MAYQAESAEIALPTVSRRRSAPFVSFVLGNRLVAIGILLIAIIGLCAIFAPWLGTVDPMAIAPTQRLKPPSYQHWFGTDALGRDVYSRALYGARVSLMVGFSVAFLTIAFGLAIGLITGFVRPVDNVLMRLMDALMSIPPIMLAIALMALTSPSLQNVIIAITVADVPRASRLVRSIVLTLRDQPFVEAAVTSGARFPRLLLKHLLPNTLAPLVVHGTYVCASAMIAEAVLSFVGAGMPPNVPSWGSMMSDGRSIFQIAYHVVIFPGVLLSMTVLAVNLVGDGLRDALDPRLTNRR